jgi:hypothetical protein
MIEREWKEAGWNSAIPINKLPNMIFKIVGPKPTIENS